VGKTRPAQEPQVDEGVSNSEIQAAGGVVWRPNSNREDAPAQVVVVHRPRHGDWSLPKGKLNPGEEWLEAAIREVREETGLSATPERMLGDVRYVKFSGGEPRRKVVRFWAMRADEGHFAPSDEVDELRWLPLDEALETLTHATDREVLGRFLGKPTRLGLVLLVRHASAGSRSKWKGDDNLRPLDDKGKAQARQLAGLLSHYDISQIVSADYVRCVQTVEPLAEAVGLPVKEEPLLSETGYPGHEEEAVAVVREFGAQGGAVVACTQGDVIPDLLARLADDERPGEGPFQAKKGAAWLLSFSDGRLWSLTYVEPPTV
jgi:8-oxo-(d)GTP phosphatase